MVKEKLLRVLQNEFLPNGGGRRLSSHIQDSYRSHLQQLRRERLSREDVHRIASDSLRTRVVIQEMRLVYNQLSGVGDQLMDLKLRQLLPESQTIGSLGRAELCALNYDLAKLASQVFGPVFANYAYERIGGVIQKAFG